MKSHPTSRTECDVPVWITIVTHNSRDWISDCLMSIHANDWPCEIVVVDNASTDETCDLVMAIAPGAHLVRETDNRGFSVACNHGMEYALRAGARLILQMNDDARLLPTTLEGLARIAGDNPDFGALIPANLRYDVDEMDPVFTAELRRNLVRQREVVSQIIPVERIPGAVLLTRAEVLRECGGLDPEFFVEGAEYDFCQRIQARGWKVGFTPSISVRHEYYRRFTNPYRLPLRKHVSELRSTAECILKDPRSTLMMAVMRLSVAVAVRMIMSIVTLNVRRAAGTVIAVVGIGTDFATIVRRREMSFNTRAPFLDLDETAAGAERFPFDEKRIVEAGR